MYMTLGFPKLFITLIGGFILLKIGLGIFHYDEHWSWATAGLRLTFLVLTYTIATYVLAQLGRLGNLASQQSEHLADATAAMTVGVEPTLNALLLVGERAEALTVLQQTLAKQPHLKEAGLDEDGLLDVLRRFPPRELDKDVARRLASRLYIEARLAELKSDLCVPLSDDEIVALAKKADLELKRRQKTESTLSDKEAAELELAERKREEEQEKLLLDWRDYDRDRSGHLSMVEAERLVADMKSDPGKMLFRQFLEADAAWKSHPTMRDRVLYLYEAFGPPRA
jgi:hypothetical protein